MNTNLKLGQHLQVNIEKLVSGGEGLARINIELPRHSKSFVSCHAEQSEASQSKDNFTVFVPYSCPEDKLLVQINEIKKNYARAIIDKVVIPSKNRTTPPCPYFFDFDQPRHSFCGGCDWQHISYSQQLEFKETIFKESLATLTGFNSIEFLPIIGMDIPWHYRNKIQQPVTMSAGELISGFYVPQSHYVVNIDKCIIQPDPVNALLVHTKELLNYFDIKPYNERRHQGGLRHLIVRQGYHTRELMLIFVTQVRELPYAKEIITELSSKFANLVSVYHNINPARTNVILGNRIVRLWGKDSVTEVIHLANGILLKFQVSPTSFFQVNTQQTEKLYQTVKIFADTNRNDNVIDVYSGSGGISICLADSAKMVYGIEEIGSAVYDAEINTKLNKISNCDFINHSAETALRKFSNLGRNKLVIVLDPPRQGCSQTVLESATDLRPEKIVYVSCNPATLVRDLKFLTAQNYQVTKTQIVDMFPQTSHLESVTLLHRK